MPSRPLPSRPDLDHLEYQAKGLRAGHEAGAPSALQLIREFNPSFRGATDAAVAAAAVTQADALLTIAREYGFASWPKLKLHVEGIEALEHRVSKLRTAFAAGDGTTVKPMRAGNPLCFPLRCKRGASSPPRQD
jgi:hypothetical protein